MTRNDESKAQPEGKMAWSVVVAYDDTSAREHAVDFCDQLVKRFWSKFEFNVSWWPFSLLQNEPTATEAAEKAAHADLVLLSSQRQEDFPATVKGWIEGWLSRRGDREGMLAGLTGTEPLPGGEESPKHRYLRQIAHRGEMDYLTQVPLNIWHPIPESLESYSNRAAEVGSVLDEILHHDVRPPALTAG
jgi:hypothetical protein